MDTEMQMFLKYPGVKKVYKPNNSADNEKLDEIYEGIIFTEENVHEVKIFKRPKGCYMLSTDPYIKQLNKRYIKEVPEYLDNLKTYIEEKNPPHKPIPVDIYHKVVKEYKEFINFHIYLEYSKLAADLTNIFIKFCDEKFRKHEVTIEVNYSPGKLFHIKKHELPVAFDESDDSLINLYNKFVGNVEALQVFFDIMDELPRQMWVINPLQPNYSNVSRRIMLQKDISVEITFDPKFATEMPKIKLFGPKYKVDPIRIALGKNFESWDDKENFIEELLKLLGINQILRKGPEDNENGVDTCGICLEYRNDKDLLSEQFCPNYSCNKCFHTECLRKWLEQRPQTSGKCPYCKLTISCDI